MDGAIRDFYGEHYEYAKMAINTVEANTGIAASLRGFHILEEKGFLDGPSSDIVDVKDGLMYGTILHINMVVDSHVDIPGFVRMFNSCLHDDDASIIAEIDSRKECTPGDFYRYYLTIRAKSNDPECEYMNVEVRISTPIMDCIGALENCIRAANPSSEAFAEASRILAMYKD